MKKLSFLFSLAVLFFCAVVTAQAQVTLYTTDFGTTAAGSTTTAMGEVPAGWSKNPTGLNAAAPGPWGLLSNSVSSGYTGASGVNNCYAENRQTTGSWVMTPAISATGYTDLSLSFGVRFSGTTNPITLTVNYSTDSTSFTLITGGTINSPGNSNWALHTLTLPAALNGATKVYIQWVATGSGSASASNVRIDDVTLTGISSSLSDGAGTASVANTGGGTFDGTNIFSTNASQTVTVTVTGVSAGDLTTVKVTVPATWSGYNAANVTLGGAFTGATNSGTGNDILLDGVTLGTTPGTIVIANVTSQNSAGAGMNGNDTWVVQTAKSGGTLTNIQTEPGTYTVIPLSNLRSGGSDGFGNSDAGGLTPVMNNQTVVVHGIVTVPNGVLTTTVSTSIIIQEGNYGMQVFKSSTNTSATLTLGTEFYVKGLVQAFDGNTEIVPSGVTSPDMFIIGTTTVPSPFVISSTTEISEGNESRLIQFNNATWDSAGQVFANLISGRGINNFNGGTGTAYLNTANTSIVGKTIPASSAALVGVVYHRAGITGNQVYKIAPRTGVDVGLSGDGTGTAKVSPTAQVASTTALTEVIVIKGDGSNTLEGVSITIPSTWTWTNAAANYAGPGFISASPVVTGDGSVGNPYVITITGAAVTNLDSGIVSIPDLNAPTSAGLTTFLVKTSVASGTLTAISSSPTVNITAGANPFEAIATGNWNSGSVWLGGFVPGSGDNVTFTTKDVVVTITDGAECNNLTMSMPDTTGTGTSTVGAILQFPASGATTLTVNGRLDLSGSVGRPVLTSNGNADAVLVCKGYVGTTVSNTVANGNKGLNMNEGTVKLTGSTSDTLKNGAGLRLGNLVIGDGTNAKSVTWIMTTSTGTQVLRSLTVKNGSSLVLGGTTYATINSIGNFSTTGLPMLTGGVTVEANANLSVNNAFAPGTFGTINIKSGGLTNNGSINLISADGSRKFRVSFGDLTADATGSNQTFSGSGTGMFTFVKVGALDTLTLQASMNVVDSLVWLNGQLVETATHTIRDTVKTKRVVVTGQVQNFGGIGFTVNDAGAGSDTTSVTRVIGTALTGGSNSSILRYFDVSPKVSSGLNAQVGFYYDNTELAGQDPQTLKLWMTTDNGTTWTYEGGTVDTTNHNVTMSGLTSLPAGKWTLADAAHSLGIGSGNYTYVNGWNMVSVPLILDDFTKSVVFPPSAAPGNAFKYSGSYQIATTLENGIGYWLKFDGTQIISLSGLPRTSDSVAVTAGWNMVGSLSNDVIAATVTSNPGGMITSPFYAYANGYQSADTIHPGKGYWIKVTQAGKLFFGSGALAAGNRIRIVETSSQPPAPPTEMNEVNTLLPASYALQQNYPNPFNPSSVIRYQLTVNGMVTLKVYNTLGVEVATLVNGMQDAGFKSVTFDASSLPSGVYYYRIQAVPSSGSGQAFSDMKKMMLVK